MVTLDIGGLKRGSRDFDFDLSNEDIEVEPTDFESISVRAELDREGDRILVRVTVSGLAHLICDRTSEPFEQAVEGTHTVLFVPEDRVEQLSEGADDDVYGFEPSDSALDITGPVRDTLILSLPTRRIAPGADELDIPTRFGAIEGDDIDPRWEALKRLSDTSE